MAGGEGKRMKTNIPKVLNLVGGEPMIARIVQKVSAIGVKKILIVSGKYEEQIKDATKHLDTDTTSLVYVPQSVPQGTGDAIKQCLPYLPSIKEEEVDVLILNGDTPLIDEALDHFVAFSKHQAPSLMVTSLDNPKGQGRICKHPITQRFDKIVEEKDASDDERLIQLVNCGVYFVGSNDLNKYVPLITNDNAQNEYYLTDICGMMRDTLTIFELPKSLQDELLNVNTRDDLCKAEQVLCKSFFSTNKLQFRTLTITDYNKGYLDLLRQLSDTITITSSQEFHTLYDEIQSNKNHIVYVVEDLVTNKIIANCTLIVEKKFIRGGKNVVHIEDVVVDSEYRGKNIGVQLLRYINALSALELDAYKVILDCKAELEPFYNKSGFSKSSIQMSTYFV